MRSTFVPIFPVPIVAPASVAGGPVPKLPRCWRCLIRGPWRQTQINGRDQPYCPAHKPDRLARFQAACLASLLAGHAKRHQRRHAFAPAA